MGYDGPIGGISRVATDAVDISGVRLAGGDRVFAMLNAANRDPAAFADADRFDLTRSPNRHLTFGHGIHILPRRAARPSLEGRIVLDRLARRMPDLRLAESEPDWADSLVLRGLRRLPVARRPG